MNALDAKDWSEAFAWICAGGFFLYKMLSGYLISNLTLSLACDRKTADVGADFLVVRATLKKGDRGAVALHDVIAEVSPAAPGEDQAKPLAATRRLSSAPSDMKGILKIVNSPSGKTPLLNLPPGEETTFSEYFKIPSAKPCVVSVTVLGGWRRDLNTRYQWRASTVALPL